MRATANTEAEQDKGDPLLHVEKHDMFPFRRDARHRQGGRTWRRSAALLAIALAAFGFCQWLFVFGPANVVRRFVQRTELSLYDSRVQALPPRRADPRIVIVRMDDETPERIRPALERPYYPLPRTCHARLVDTLFAAGAKVIGFDVMFTQQLDGEDPTFARALRRHGNVVAAVIPHSETHDGVEQTTFEEPSPLLAPYLTLSSIVVSSPVRWVDPYQVDDGDERRWPHFGFAVAAAYFGETKTPPTIRDTFRWGTRIDAPLSTGENVLIRYAGPAGTLTADSVSYADVYNGDWRKTHPANFFRGKIVLVGRVSQLDDVQQTPVGQMPGVEVHANIARMALTGDYLRQASVADILWAGAALIVLFLIVLWRYALPAAVLFAIGEGAAWALGISSYQLRANGLWLDPVQPTLALGLVVAACAVYESRRMRGQFEQFVPSWVAARALTGQATTGTGDGFSAQREVTVVFCDIRNFTSLSESRPAESVEILRRFFAEGDRIARRHGTELDKFVGDEIMLYFFNRPGRWGASSTPRESHPLRAARWAQEMQSAAGEIDASGLAGEIGFRVGIGIATGTAREGLIGVQGRVQNTVIGDVVNTASRLQEATKQVGRPTLLNEAVYQAVAGEIPAESLGLIALRGKTEPILVWAL